MINSLMYKWNFDFDLFMIYLVHLKVQNTQKKKKKKMHEYKNENAFFLFNSYITILKKKKR